MTHRVAVICVVLLSGVVVPAHAQPPGPAPSQAQDALPIFDLDSYWNDGDLDLMNTVSAGLFRRYRCRVVIQTFPKEPNDWAEGADLNDKSAVLRAINAVRDRLVLDLQNMGNSDPYAVIVLGPGKVTFGVRFSLLSGEDVQRVLAGFTERVTSNDTYIARGVPDMLKAIDEACQGRVAPPIGPAAAAFKAAAAAGGLSGPGLDAVLNARGIVGFDDLTDFVKDELNDGRKGDDLKDDLLTFIKLYKEKK